MRVTLKDITQVYTSCISLFADLESLTEEKLVMILKSELGTQLRG